MQNWGGLKIKTFFYIPFRRPTKWVLDRVTFLSKRVKWVVRDFTNRTKSTLRRNIDGINKWFTNIERAELAAQSKRESQSQADLNEMIKSTDQMLKDMGINIPTDEEMTETQRQEALAREYGAQRFYTDEPIPLKDISTDRMQY